MAYSQGGLIEATDYNNFLNGSNQLNTVWSTGTGNAGYGQTALSTVSQSGTVTATQWATLINTLNSALTHQAGSGSGISATTAGTTINYLSTLGTNINTAYTNRLNYASSGSTSTGQASTASTFASAATNSATASFTYGTRCAFASADAARYFFNAGGRLKFNVSAAQSSSTTARTTAIINLVGYFGSVTAFGATTNGGRSGTGGTVTTNATNKGYWTTTYNTNTTLQAITNATASYTSDTASIYVNCNGAQGSNGGNGLNIDFYLTLNSTQGANAGSLSFDDSYGVSVTRSIDITYPESTNLTNTWGTPTFSAL